MTDNGLDGRKVLVLPNSPDGLRGSGRRAAVEAEAKLLSNAIADALDRIPIFNRDGQPVLLIDGALRVVNNQMLAWVLEGYFATMHVMERNGRLELEYRGVRANEIALRHMLTAERKHGGLVGCLPMLTVEQPRVAAVAPEQPKSSPLPEVQAEIDAGARTRARYANAGERTRLEAQRGAEVSARHAGRQVAVEEYAARPPGKTDGGAVDPATPPRA
jgi:hypothetical protein